tara:strand:+ start:677 stop:859 length:183 start_codon:yes stop_codon:yes gene_type:complete
MRPSSFVHALWHACHIVDRRGQQHTSLPSSTAPQWQNLASATALRPHMRMLRGVRHWNWP